MDTTAPHGAGRPADEIELVLVGDTNVQGRDDPASAFRHVLPLLRSADLVFGHLECPFLPSTTAEGRPDIPHKPRWAHADPRMVEGLVAAGFGAVSLASNVTHPRRAATATVEVLDRAGIGHCGAGRDAAAARAPAILEARGTRFGFLSYTSVFWPYDHAATATEAGSATIRAHTAYEPGRRSVEMPGEPPTVVTWPDAAELAAMEADVRRLRPLVDVLVLSCHWGVSSSEVTCDYQRAIARAAVAAGADLVFGHHPHVVQGAEVIDGRPVFYSLGNFAFDWSVMRGRYREGLMLRCRVRCGRIVAVEAMPVQRDAGNDVAPIDPRTGDGRWIADTLVRLSAGFGTAVRVEAGRIVVPVGTAAETLTAA